MRHVSILALALTALLAIPATVPAQPIAEDLDVQPYLYVPGVLRVSSEGAADEWLTNAEATFGIDSQNASHDPSNVTQRDLQRVDRAAAILHAHWKALHARCDADAVFALMYLETTYTVREHIEARYFDDNAKLAVVTVAFIQLYLDAYYGWHGGDLSEVPLPWQEAFRAADEKRTSVLEDMFLGMNGHINYDLAVAMWQTGIDASRKADHDRINRVLLAAAPRVNERIAEEYDPSRASDNDSSSDPLTHTTLWPIYNWRELAWRNAEALTGSLTNTQRGIVLSEMEVHGYTVAQAFQSPKNDGEWEARMDYCRSNQ